MLWPRSSFTLQNLPLEIDPHKFHTKRRGTMSTEYDQMTGKA
jgi:hypothetical protein